MKHHRTLIITSVGVLLLAGLLYAQTSLKQERKAPPKREAKTEELIKIVQTLYDELAMPGDDQTCSLNYSVTTVSRDRNNDRVENTTRTSYLGSSDRLVVTSDQLSLYQDSTVGLAVLPEQKEIQVFPSTVHELRMSREESMHGFQTELFERSEVIRCELNDETGVCQLILKPEPGFSDWYRIESVEILFGPEERRLHSIQATFESQAQYESMKMIYEEVECVTASDSDSLTSFSALESVFTSAGNLRSEYQDYKVVDHRTR